MPSHAPTGALRIVLAVLTLARAMLWKTPSSAGRERLTLAAAALEPDGKIVAVGRALLPTGGATVPCPVTTRGELDPSFGQGGQVLIEAGSLADAPTVIIVQPDGKTT